MTKRFTFKITSDAEDELWSLQRISKLLSGIAIMKEGLDAANGDDADDHFANLAGVSQAKGIAAFEVATALRYLHTQGFAMVHFPNYTEVPYHEDALSIVGRGFLQTYVKADHVRLVALQRGSIEGTIEEIGKIIGQGIGWIFSHTLNPLIFRDEVVKFVKNPVNNGRYANLGAISVGRELAAEGLEDLHAKLVVTSGSDLTNG